MISLSSGVSSASASSASGASDTVRVNLYDHGSLNLAGTGADDVYNATFAPGTTALTLPTLLANGQPLKPGDLYTVAVDDVAHTMTFTGTGDDKAKAPTIVLRYRRDGDDEMSLDGSVAGAVSSVRLKRFDSSKSLLMTRGFHWISEVPFNR